MISSTPSYHVPSTASEKIIAPSIKDPRPVLNVEKIYPKLVVNWGLTFVWVAQNLKNAGDPYLLKIRRTEKQITY